MTKIAISSERVDELNQIISQQEKEIRTLAAENAELRRAYVEGRAKEAAPIPMRIPCPACGALHVDEGEFATKVHHTHACQHCGMVWRPAIVATVGVLFLPGFKNEETAS